MLASIFTDILMGTSVHIPIELLKAVDRRARELEQGSEWSASFFETLRGVDRETVEDAGLMLAAIRGKRSSKRPPKL
jgi:hypothetical protein